MVLLNIGLLLLWDAPCPCPCPSACCLLCMAPLVVAEVFKLSLADAAVEFALSVAIWTSEEEQNTTTKK
jgi:hypothetical protein